MSCHVFELHRDEDATGVSGTGVVAEGVVFSNGRSALTWKTAHTSVAVYDRIEDVVAIHGHEGRTRVVWGDQMPAGLIHERLAVTPEQKEMVWAALVNAKMRHAEMLGRPPSAAEEELLESTMAAVSPDDPDGDAPATAGPVSLAARPAAVGWLTVPMVLMWVFLGAGLGLLFSSLM